MKRIFLTFITNILLMSSLYAMDMETNLEEEFNQISRRYDLCPQKYTESLTEHYNTAKKIVSEAVSEASIHGKPVGIVVGENHKAEGAKCFEMLLLPVARSINIQHCLVELTPEKLERVINSKTGYEFGAAAGYLQRLIQEAKRLGMDVIPINKDIKKASQKNVGKDTEEDPADKTVAALENIKEMILTGEEREKHFIEKMLNLNKSFIDYNGSNHLSSLYYDMALNERYFLIFINCSFPRNEEMAKKHQLIINTINDDSVTRIYTQGETFLMEKDRSYKMPVMYNQKDSMIYRMLRETNPDYLIGVNLKEIREG